jgi:valyl-tRNA synthetase
VFLAPLGQDVLFSTKKCEIGRNFANKLWNAGRFLLMHVQRLEEAGEWHGYAVDTVAVSHELPAASGLEDRWMLSRYHATIRDLHDSMDRYRVNDMAKLLYDVVWHDFCDWYIELIKDRLQSDEVGLKRETLVQALHMYDGLLRLLHPVMPFITEEVWHRLRGDRDGHSIMQQALPAFDQRCIDEQAEREMRFLQSLVDGVRTILGELNVPAGKNCDVVIRTADTIQRGVIENNTHFLRRLARIATVNVGEQVSRPSLSASAVVAGADVYVPLEGLIDVDIERKRLRKEIARVTGLLNGLDSKLENDKFLSHAPADVIAREREKQSAFRLTLEKLHANLHSLDQD